MTTLTPSPVPAWLPGELVVSLLVCDLDAWQRHVVLGGCEREYLFFFLSLSYSLSLSLSVSLSLSLSLSVKTQFYVKCCTEQSRISTDETSVPEGRSEAEPRRNAST